MVNGYDLNLFPNPFNPQTTVRFETGIRNYTEISIYNITGQKIANLYNGELEAGIHNFELECFGPSFRNVSNSHY